MCALRRGRFILILTRRWLDENGIKPRDSFIWWGAVLEWGAVVGS
jgi:hypothetical protein